jgi:hypothetical protein
VLGKGQDDRRAPDASALAETFRQFRQTFDARRGGFGDAPKFPRPSELLFLFRAGGAAGNADGRHAALETLRAMALGGVYDHVGGGFHRYAVDAAWRVPHFEKMLYDQAQLVLVYLEAFQLTADPLFRRVAAETLEYVRRDLTDAAGGFCSAEDADSLPAGAAAGAHKAEGAFYVWSAREIEDLLGSDAEAFGLRFGVEPGGNATHDPHGEFRGRNILYAARSLDEVAQLTGRPSAEVELACERGLAALRRARSGRPRPHLDDKVLTAWNGLMIAAAARSARVLGDAESLAAAGRAASFLKERMWSGRTGRLLRRYRDGSAAIEAYAEDYAFLIFGLLELFQAGHEPAWLEWAVALQGRQDALFGDPAGGGWFSTSGEDSSVLVRIKEDYDGAEPAATSVGAWNAVMLAHLTGDQAFRERAEAAFRLFGPRMSGAPRAVPMMLAALALHQAGMRQVVIVGERQAADTQTLAAAARAFLPFSVVMVVEPGAHQDEVARVVPAIAGMRMRDGRATAYVCRDFACEAPTSDAGELARLLKPAERGKMVSL